MQVNNDLQQLRSQITRSPLLTQIEKAEWLQLMGEMTEAQSSELSAILVASEQALQQINQQNSQKAQVAKQQQAAELQKAIQHNLEKPQEQLQPATHPAVTQPDWRAQIAEQQKNPLSSASGLKLKLDSSKETSGADLPQEPAMPAIQPPPVPKPSPVPQKVEPKYPSFEIKTPDDLSNLSVDYLHEGDPKANLEHLLETIANLTRHYKFTSFIGKIEESPLYKEYSRLGLTVLNDTQENRDAIYQSYQKNAAQHSQPYLSKEEFEAFTDFRRDEDHIVG